VWRSNYGRAAFLHDNSAVQLPHEATVVALFGPLKVAAAMLQKGWIVDSVDTTGYEIMSSWSSSTSKLTDSALWHNGNHATFARRSPDRSGDSCQAPTCKDNFGGTHATLTVAGYNYEKKHGRVGRAHRAYAQLVELFDVIVAGDGEEAIFLAVRERLAKSHRRRRQEVAA